MEDQAGSPPQTAETVQEPDQLARLDDQSIVVLAIIPVVIIAVLAVAAAALYFIRRSKNWNELDDSMRIDDGDKPVPSDASFNTQDIAGMDPTKPSQRLTELSRHTRSD